MFEGLHDRVVSKLIYPQLVQIAVWRLPRQSGTKTHLWPNRPDSVFEPVQQNLVGHNIVQISVGRAPRQSDVKTHLWQNRPDSVFERFQQNLISHNRTQIRLRRALRQNGIKVYLWPNRPDSVFERFQQNLIYHSNAQIGVGRVLRQSGAKADLYPTRPDRVWKRTQQTGKRGAAARNGFKTVRFWRAWGDWKKQPKTEEKKSDAPFFFLVFLKMREIDRIPTPSAIIQYHQTSCSMTFSAISLRNNVPGSPNSCKIIFYADSYRRMTASKKSPINKYI